MKSTLRLSACLIAAALAVLATGCSKRPLRPNPSQTVLGSGDGGNINPSDVSLMQDSTLVGRDPNDPMSRADFSQFQAVLFDFDSAAIRVSERAKVEAAATNLKSNPSARLLIVGRCDWRGTTEYNQGLGDRRARAVKDFLATFGIAASRVEIVSKGDLDAKEGGTAADMQQDRRADIGLLN